MYKKTSSIQCARYCEVMRQMPEDPKAYYVNTKTVKRKSVDELMVADRSFYVEVNNGIVGILFMDKTDQEPELFAIHKIIRIRPGVRFNFVALSPSGRITTYVKQRANLVKTPIAPFTPTVMRESFSVPEIYAYYYSTKGNHYVFEGEEHPYWEMTFIDNGELVTTVEGKSFHLPSRSLFFYAPGQFHTQHTPEGATCTYMTVMFDLKDLDSSLISKRVIPASKNMLQILSIFMHLSNEAWDHQGELLLGLLKVLITFALDETKEVDTAPHLNPMHQHYEDELLNEVLHYIRSHIHESLGITEICDNFAISRSSLQALFKHNLNTSPKLYINRVKLEQSKLLLKNSARTVSEVSDLLGFASIHYFSRKFKLEYGISPSEYAKSIAN